MIKKAARNNPVVTRDPVAYQDANGWHEGIVMDYKKKRIVLIDTPVCKYILLGETWGMRPASKQALFVYVQHEGRQKVVKALFQRGTIEDMLKVINTFNETWLTRYIVKGVDTWDTKPPPPPLNKKRSEDKKVRDRELQAIWRKKNAKSIHDRNAIYRQIKREKKMLADADKQKQNAKYYQDNKEAIRAKQTEHYKHKVITDADKQKKAEYYQKNKAKAKEKLTPS